MSGQVSQEMWDGWLLHPATQALQKLLLRRQEELKEQWAAGHFTDMGQFGTAILNAKAIGKCEAYERIGQLELAELNEEQEDDE